jgi:hypothetical protein
VTTFTLQLLARSGRWIPPALVYLVWLVLVLANPGPALSNAAGMFFAVVVLATWLTVSAGNVDDDPHRDLCAAAAGSPARLHVHRALAVLVPTIAIVAVTAVLTASTGSLEHHGRVAVVAASLALLVGAALIGTAIGAFLHRPILRNVAWGFLLAVAAVLAVVFVPPIRHVLRTFDHGGTAGVLLLLPASAAGAAALTWLSATLAARRS